MKKLALILFATVLAVASVSTEQAPAPAGFALTVDSIMRGPELVGNPPNNLRWSGDSQSLYFEWLMPKEDLAATWVVGRAGGAPRRLSETERRLAPLANGQWDAKRRRILGIDRGDIVIIDTVANKRIDVTRTTGNESNPRWARGETHVTFVRDNNLFIVPVQDVTAGALVQLTDAAVRRADPRPTDSQKFLKDEEQKLLDWVEEEAARRKRREALERARALPRFELTDRQTIADAAVSADGKFAYLVVNDRAQARTAQVPRFVSESAFTEEINARTKVGDAQDRRRLAVLNLESGDGMWVGLDGVSDAIAIPKPVDGDEREAAPSREARARLPRAKSRGSATCGGARRRCRPMASTPWSRCAPPTTPSDGSRWSMPRPARPRFSITSKTRPGSATAARAGWPTAAACGSSPSTTAGCTSTPWIRPPRRRRESS